MIGKETDSGATYKTLELNSSDAKELLAKNKKNRKISQAKVREYSRAMSKGNWQMNGQPITFSTEDVVLDGQHRLLALSLQEEGVTIKTMVGFGLPPEAFDTIDIGKRRSPADLLTLYDIDSKDATTLAGGAKMFHNYLERVRIQDSKALLIKNSKKTKGKKTPIEKVERVVLQNKDIYEFINKPEYKDLFKDGMALINANKGTLMLSPAESLFMYALTVGLNAEKGKEFCKQLCTNTGIEEGSPVHVLFSRLNPNNKRYEMRKNSKIVCTIQAWNYFVSDREMPSTVIAYNKIKAMSDIRANSK